MAKRYYPLLAAVGLAAVLAFAPAPGPVAPRPVHASGHTHVLAGINDWCNANTFLCMRDPSDGGLGTFVLDSNDSSSNSLDWAVIGDSGRCPGSVITSNCPGGALSARFRGDPLVVLKNKGQGHLCTGVSAGHSWDATMRTCDTGSEPSTAFAWVRLTGGSDCQQGSAPCYGFASLTWASANPQGPNGWLSSFTAANSNLIATGSTTHDAWNAIGS